MKIEVVNKYKTDPAKLDDIVVNIMRPSPLGNPFKGDRYETVPKYRKWLWSEIEKKELVWNMLTDLANESKSMDVYLVCCCAPLPCHGDIIKNAINWILEGENNG